MMSGGGVYSADGVGIALSAGQFSLRGLETVRLTVNTPSINGTTSTGLVIALLANTNYVFSARVHTVGGGTATANYQVHALAGGAALGPGYYDLLDLTTSIFTANGLLPAVTTSFGGGGNNTNDYMLIVEGIVTVGATPTNLQLDVVSTATDNNTKAGSWMEAKVVA